MFKVGDKVVCIDDNWGFFRGELVPVKGEVYTVRFTTQYRGRQCIRLFELKNEPREYDKFTECVFGSERFRKVDEQRKRLTNKVTQKLVEELEEYLELERQEEVYEIR